MRIVKFSAKEMDSGIWRDGQLSFDIDIQCPIISDVIGLSANFDAPLGENVLKSYIVKPETVSEYTGLKDKKNKEIYENFIIKGVADDFYNKDHAFVGVVKWDIEDAGFYLKSNSYILSHIKFRFVKEMEVVGNIFDNPELMNI
jgi:uncharacterized phage protein (TIGR01671 family)